MRSFILSLAIVLPIAAAATIPACSSSDDSNGSDAGGGVCTTTKDCTGSNLCGFAISDGCTAIGHCVAPPTGSALPFEACGCQGQPVDYVSSGYTTAPVSSGLACKDAAVEDSGPAGDDGGLDAPNDAPNEAAPPSEGGSDGGPDGSGDASDGAPE